MELEDWEATVHKINDLNIKMSIMYVVSHAVIEGILILLVVSTLMMITCLIGKKINLILKYVRLMWLLHFLNLHLA